MLIRQEEVTIEGFKKIFRKLYDLDTLEEHVYEADD